MPRPVRFASRSNRPQRLLEIQARREARAIQSGSAVLRASTRDFSANGMFTKPRIRSGLARASRALESPTAAEGRLLREANRTGTRHGRFRGSCRIESQKLYQDLLSRSAPALESDLY